MWVSSKTYGTGGHYLQGGDLCFILRSVHAIMSTPLLYRGSEGLNVDFQLLSKAFIFLQSTDLKLAARCSKSSIFGMFHLTIMHRLQPFTDALKYTLIRGCCA